MIQLPHGVDTIAKTRVFRASHLAIAGRICRVAL